MIPNLGWYILIVWLTVPKDVCRENLMIWFCPRTLGGHQRLQPLEYISGWWFGTWILCFHSVGHVIIPTDELIFFRGVGWNHQPDILLKIFRQLTASKIVVRALCHIAEIVTSGKPFKGGHQCMESNLVPSGNLLHSYWKWLINSWFTYSKWW